MASKEDHPVILLGQGHVVAIGQGLLQETGADAMKIDEIEELIEKNLKRQRG